jgi:chitodextrinase
MRRHRLVLVLAAALLVGTTARPAPPVPAAFEDLYQELTTAVSDFRNLILAGWDGSRPPVTFSAQLHGSYPGLGPRLLTEDQRAGIRHELDGLKALGVKAVTMDVSFPMLYRPFHQSEEEYQQYLAFYTGVAQDVRSRGLKLIVATGVLVAEGSYNYWDLAPYYATLSLPDYQQGRMEVARVVALNLRPDYLSVIHEPDNEAGQTGKPPLGTVDGSRALLDVILAGLQAAGVEGVAVGAGVGTWQEDYLSYVHSFASTSIDFVGIHTYPVSRDFLARTLEIADVARGYGKRVGMGDTWLYKSRESELGLVGFPVIIGRDVFSFWEPLDAYHLQVMVELAHYERLEFLSAFWSGYFRGYLDYDDSTRNLPPAELKRRVEAVQTANILAGAYTGSGIAYKNAIVVPPDVAPPAAPPDFAIHLTAPASVILAWSPSSDDVGTAAYEVFRDGVPLTRTILTSFADSSLAEARRYVYSVAALDASGNRSPLATAAVTTPDVTAPSTPSNLTATASIAGAQIGIGLAWAPASDNVGVSTYLIHAGTSPDSLGVVAQSPVASFTVPNAAPQTTYYFAVSAADAARNLSGRSIPAAITTPVIPDTTAPTVYIAYPSDGATVSRSTYLYAIAYDRQGGVYDTPSGPAAVQFRIDGVNVGPEQTIPYLVVDQVEAYRLPFNSQSWPDGPHVITAVARDNSGNVATSAGVVVRTDN